ncbi:MAG: hypothetical protein P1V20_29635, partial [Verrucomicrobiales bacterium]|nr:hypothetical protein [Verrucomicrobiales bacterium]
MGALTELSELAEQLHGDAVERGDQYSVTNLQAYVIPILLTYRDDPERALKERKDAIEAWSKEGFYAQHLFGMVSYCETQLYLGAPQMALDFMKQQWPQYKKALYHRIQYPHNVLLSLRGRASLMAWKKDGDPRHLKRILKVCQELDHSDTVYGKAFSHSIRAGLEIALGNEVESDDLLRSAVALYDQANMALHVAATRQVLANLDNTQDSNQLWEDAAKYWDRESIPNPGKLGNSLIPLPNS